MFFRPVPENKFSHSPKVHHGFVPKFQNQPPQRKKHKKGILRGPLFRGGGVSVGRGGSDEEKAEGLTDYRQVVERSETPVTDVRNI